MSSAGRAAEQADRRQSRLQRRARRRAGGEENSGDQECESGCAFYGEDEDLVLTYKEENRRGNYPPRRGGPIVEKAATAAGVGGKETTVATAGEGQRHLGRRRR